MIKLYTADNQHFEQTADKEVIAELKRLRDELDTCFSNAGIREEWVLDHLLIAVAEQVFEDKQQISQQSISDEKTAQSEELVQTVIKLLVDTGYPDVAARFSHLRGLTSEAFISHHHSSWDEDRLHKLISKRLPLSESACRDLVKRIAAQLRQIGFQSVSDNLINELAEHNIDALAKSERRKVTIEASDWLVTPGFWEAFFSSEIALLTRIGVLRIQPVSQLFPVPRLILKCEKLIEHRVEKPVTELSLIPALRDVSDKIAEAAEILINQTGGQDKSSNDVQAYLLIQDLEGAVKKHLQPRSKKSKQRLTSELTDVLRATLTEQCPYELAVLVQR